MAVLGLDCCVLAFSSCDKQELLFAAGHLTEVASLVAECGLQVCGSQQLQLVDSRVQVQQLWCTGLVVRWQVSCISRWIPRHWITGKSPKLPFIRREGTPENLILLCFFINFRFCFLWKQNLTDHIPWAQKNVHLRIIINNIVNV